MNTRNSLHCVSKKGRGKPFKCFKYFSEVEKEKTN